MHANTLQCVTSTAQLMLCLHSHTHKCIYKHIPANMSATCLDISIELKYHLENENIDFKGLEGRPEVTLHSVVITQQRGIKRREIDY